MASGEWGASPAHRRRPCAETIVVAVLCLADLAATVALLHNGQATEGNPLMAYFLQFGLGAFCAAKLGFIVPPLLIAEWYRRYNDALVRGTLRFVAVAYALIYAGGVLLLNRHLL